MLTKENRTCGVCTKWLKVYAVHVSTDYEGVYEQLVRALKFDLKRQAADAIIDIMSRNLPNILVENDEVIVCPLPTAPSRIRQRGFDHVKLLSTGYMRHVLDNPNVTDFELKRLLGRKTNVRQLGSSRAQRMKQMENEYYLRSKINLQGKTILLFDDVMTSGASLSAAAFALKKAGARRIYATVFAQKN